MTGFYAGGEVGPQAMANGTGRIATQTGGAMLQGFTCVFGLFSVPEKTKAAASHLPSTMDSTPEGLGAYLASRPRPPRAVGFSSSASSSSSSVASSSAPSSSSSKAPVEAPAAAAAAAAESAAPIPTDEEIDGLGVHALKELIVRAGLSFSDCVEKTDLQIKAKLAANVLLVRNR
jgi:hypothetical protein